MLRRLLGALLPVLLVFAVVLSLPLARMLADRATQTVYLDRLADADRFATLADRGLRAGRTAALLDELRQYHAVYGIRAWLVSVDGTTILSADGQPPPPVVLSSRDLDLAERGVQPDPPPPVSPTDRGDLLVAVPIGTGAEAIGAIVTLSPAGDLRRQIALRWAALAAVGTAITAVLAGALWPFSRWLLRPVALLDEAAGRIAAGRTGARVGLAAGPPELRRLADSFDRMAAVVERTLHRQQEFVADASHQLRTPLTSLRLALDNLGAELPGRSDSPARQDWDDAVQETLTMGRLLDGLLALTRLSAEPGTPQDVAAVLAEAEPAWRSRCAAAGLRLELASATDDQADGDRDGSDRDGSDRDGGRELVALAPPGGLRHLLDELVENACRLSGGSRVQVQARRQQGADGRPEVCIAVRDDGIGLDDEQRAGATRRFWRAPGQQNTDGSGLGLAIVAELVAVVDGRVQLRDAAPGLHVQLTLPVPPP